MGDDYSQVEEPQKVDRSAFMQLAISGPSHFLEECKELGIKLPAKRKQQEKKPKQTWSINQKQYLTTPLDAEEDVVL